MDAAARSAFVAQELEKASVQGIFVNLTRREVEDLTVVDLPQSGGIRIVEQGERERLVMNRQPWLYVRRQPGTDRMVVETSFASGDADVRRPMTLERLATFYREALERRVRSGEVARLGRSELMRSNLEQWFEVAAEGVQVGEAVDRAIAVRESVLAEVAQRVRGGSR